MKLYREALLASFAVLRKSAVSEAAALASAVLVNQIYDAASIQRPEAGVGCKNSYVRAGFDGSVRPAKRQPRNIEHFPFSQCLACSFKIRRTGARLNTVVIHVVAGRILLARRAYVRVGEGLVFLCFQKFTNDAFRGFEQEEHKL